MSEKVLKIRNGKFVEVDAQVIRWQKRMRKFRKHQKQILETILQWYGGDADKAALFLRTPHPELGDQTPKSFLNPSKAKQLAVWIRKLSKVRVKPREN